MNHPLAIRNEVTPCTIENNTSHGYKETMVTWVEQGCVVVHDTNVPITEDVAAALAMVEQLASAHEVDKAFESFKRRQHTRREHATCRRSRR